MKILIVPMPAMARTDGPFSRTVSFITAMKKQGVTPAICAAHDVNYKPVDGIKNYAMTVPMPMGLPKPMAERAMKVGIKLGMPGRKTIHSFEEVLFITGALKEKFLRSSIQEIRSAIKDFNPDVVYSEFNISAIIAAELEQKAVCCSYSFPVKTSFATSPQFSGAVRKILKEFKLNDVNSSLELFERADMRFVPSCPELEPVTMKDTFYCGSLKERPEFCRDQNANKVLVYMGNGTITESKMLNGIYGAFKNTGYEVYIAGAGLKDETDGNIHKAAFFNFRELLPSTAIFINHGGQNSIADGLVFGAPQIIFPGKVFERRYNADSCEKNGAGIVLNNFDAEEIKTAAAKIAADKSFGEKAFALGEKLTSQGGADSVIKKLIEKYA